MRVNRLFVSAAAIALVAGPGLAMAQNGPPSETPPVETPPVTEAPPEDTPPVETPPVEVPEDTVPEDEVEELEVEELEAEELEAEEVEDEGDDEGHGETISALAECLPSGAELHGTGFNKGFIMSQAASGGEVELELPDQGTTSFVLPEEVETLCAAVIASAEAAEAPETAKGRPDWAGPKEQAPDDGDVSTSSEDRRGPPAHANAGGKNKGPKGNGR